LPDESVHVTVSELLNVVGIQGQVGVIGERGRVGAIGQPGQRGESGPQGPSGPTGATGSPGQPGFQGFTGQNGFRGPTGATGFQGFAGQPGQSGPDGAVGAVGVKGGIGPAGLAGSPGSIGFQGVQGFTGTPGVQGIISSAFNIVIALCLRSRAVDGRILHYYYHCILAVQILFHYIILRKFPEISVFLGHIFPMRMFVCQSVNHTCDCCLSGSRYQNTPHTLRYAVSSLLIPDSVVVSLGIHCERGTPVSSRNLTNNPQ